MCCNDTEHILLLAPMIEKFTANWRWCDIDEDQFNRSVKKKALKEVDDIEVKLISYIGYGKWL